MESSATGATGTDEVLTVKDVAGLLKLAEKTVYSMVQQGELPGFKVRGQWRLRRDDLDRWIEDQKQLARPLLEGRNDRVEVPIDHQGP